MHIKMHCVIENIDRGIHSNNILSHRTFERSNFFGKCESKSILYDAAQIDKVGSFLCHDFWLLVMKTFLL